MAKRGKRTGRGDHRARTKPTPRPPGAAVGPGGGTATAEWIDEHDLTWLDRAPKIRMLPDVNKRRPYPLNWDEQARLFKDLLDHLSAMALFAVNTGTP